VKYIKSRYRTRYTTRVCVSDRTTFLFIVIISFECVDGDAAQRRHNTVIGRYIAGYNLLLYTQIDDILCIYYAMARAVVTERAHCVYIYTPKRLINDL